MARFSQNMGLKPEAEKFLEEMEAVVIHTKKDDDHQFPDPDIHTYRLKDGDSCRDCIQAQYWSSGPVSFLCLEWTDGSCSFEWTKEEMQERL